MRTKRRVIPEERRGPNAGAYSGQVTLAADVPISQSVTQWTARDGIPRMVTVVGSSPGQDAAISSLDTMEIGAVLRYRAGGLARTDRWVWNPTGWRRTVLASEVEVTAVRSPFAVAAVQPVVVGAGVCDEAPARDECVLTIQDGNPFEEIGPGGYVTRTARFPHGTHEFRVWQNPSIGSFNLGFVQADGTFLAFLTGLGLSELVEWVPSGNFNAIEYNDSGTNTTALAWVHTRG